MKEDRLIEELREVMEERELSMLATSRFVEASPRQIGRWLKYESRPTLLYRKAIKLGIERIRRLP